MVISSYESLFSSICKSVKFRVGRLYNTFYYGQYTGKFSLLIGFPIILSAIRFRSESFFGYYIIIKDDDIIPVPTVPKFLSPFSDSLSKLYAWKNGKKIYLNNSETVEDMLKRVYSSDKSKITNDILVGCRGRVFHPKDNVSFACRAFCKNDPRLVIWKDTDFK